MKPSHIAAVMAVTALASTGGYRSSSPLVIEATKENLDHQGRWLPSHIPGTVPHYSQKQVRKNRRRRHAAGDKKAFR